MPPTYPFWFKQRQCKADPVDGAGLLKVSGPNLGEAYLGISQTEDLRWRAFLRAAAEGPEVAATEAEIENATDAWEAAFELYRTHVIV
jgi:hypothetical protein